MKNHNKITPVWTRLWNLNKISTTSSPAFLLLLHHNFPPFKQAYCLISRAARIFFIHLEEQGLRYWQLKTSSFVECKNANDRTVPQNHHQITGTAETILKRESSKIWQRLTSIRGHCFSLFHTFARQHYLFRINENWR